MFFIFTIVIVYNVDIDTFRIFWIAACLTVLVYFIVQVTSSLLRYYEYNTVTNTDLVSGKPVKFPAVTLCNQNNFRFVNTLLYSVLNVHKTKKIGKI